MRAIVVEHRSPWRMRILMLLLTLLVMAALVGMFLFGQYRAGFDRAASHATIESLQSQLQSAQKQVADMKAHMVLLERSQDVDSTARRNVQVSVEGLQSQVLKLREELAFYKGIVSPENGQHGLRVQSVKFAPGGAKNLYHYSIVLIQALKHDRRVSGIVYMKFYGALAGKPAVLDARDIVLNKAKPPSLHFSFQYFQTLEGNVVLPADFHPGRVEVTIRRHGKDAPIQQDFDWSAVSG